MSKFKTVNKTSWIKLCSPGMGAIAPAAPRVYATGMPSNWPPSFIGFQKPDDTIIPRGSESKSPKKVCNWQKECMTFRPYLLSYLHNYSARSINILRQWKKYKVYKIRFAQNIQILCDSIAKLWAILSLTMCLLSQNKCDQTPLLQ